MRRADHVADVGQVRRLDARDAEIADLDAAVGVDQDVRWLDVAMDHTCRMRVGKRIEQLADDFADLAKIVADFLFQMLRQRLAVDELHDDVRELVVLAVVVDLHDVRMHEASGGPRFMPEAQHHMRMQRGVRAGRRLRNRLDRDRARNGGIEAAVNAPHGALAEHALDCVLADFFRVRHGVLSGCRVRLRRRLEREPHRERGAAAGGRCDVDASAVLLHDLV